MFRHLLLQIGGANIENPPTSSSLAEENASARSSRHCSLRSLRLALVARRLPHSLADEKHVYSLDRPGQPRASLAPCGGARLPTLAAQSQFGTPALQAVASRAKALSSMIINRIRTAPTITLAEITLRP